MPQDAPPNGSAQDPAPDGPWSRVAGMQAKLHRWAAADPGRRFDDLYNLVHDPATLLMAFNRVAGNKGANTPGVDGITAAWVEQKVGVPGFLDDLRAQLKAGTFGPLPVRERMIPKPGGSGKVRKLGIPTEPANCAVAQDREVPESFVTVTHPFHPLSGQRLRVLFERKLAAGLAVSCEGGPLGSLMLPLTWTDRGCAAADGPLTYEVLVGLAAEISAVSTRHEP